MHRWSRLEHHLTAALNQGWHWLRTVPHLEAGALLGMVALLLLLQALGYHEPFLPWMPVNGDEVPRDWHPPDLWVLMYHYLMPYLKLLGLLGGVVLHLALLRAQNDMRRLLLPVWLACAVFAVLLGIADFQGQWRELHELTIGKPFPLFAYLGKVVLQSLAVLSPALALTYYQRCNTWERYVLRLFAEPLAFCLAAFCSLWLLADWIDNMKDFQEAKVPFSKLLSFYFGLLPYVVVECLTPVLLLSLLHVMNRLVRGNELVALIGCGLSPARVARPILVTSALLCLLGMAFNYDWATRGEAERQAMMRGMKAGLSGTLMATSVMHYDEGTRRQWFIAAVPYRLRDEKLRGVQVRQFDEQGNLEQSWFGATGYWWGEGRWAFFRGQHLDYRKGTGTPKVNWYNHDESGQQSVDVRGWKETLWDIVSSTQQSQVMGVVELAGWFQTHNQGQGESSQHRHRAELWHRFSLPWQGFFLVLAAAALTPLHSRRGLWKGVGLSLGLYFVLLFVNSATLNLARGGHAPAGVVWLPHVLLAEMALLTFRARFGAQAAASSTARRKLTWKRFMQALRGRCTERCHRTEKLRWW